MEKNKPWLFLSLLDFAIIVVKISYEKNKTEIGYKGNLGHHDLFGDFEHAYLFNRASFLDSSTKKDNFNN